MPARKTAKRGKRAARKRGAKRSASTRWRSCLIGLFACALIVGAYYWLVVRPASRPGPPSGRAIENATELQIALIRNGFSPGSIDGQLGSQTRRALRAYQNHFGLDVTGELDPPTSAVLLVEDPCFALLELDAQDLSDIAPKPATWTEREFLDGMHYNSALEMVAERSQSDPDFIAALNPNFDWRNLRPGARIKVPHVRSFQIQPHAASIRIELTSRSLQVLGTDGRLLFHCPVSIARRIDKRPSGQLSVTVRVEEPNYTFNPAILKNTAAREGITEKFIIPPGPNNPVGVAWIGLSRPSYGIHGTPVPEQVGRTESSGCFRLANWNARTVLQASWVGMPVTIEP